MLNRFLLAPALLLICSTPGIAQAPVKEPSPL
jgi:hypothetical protein